MPFPVAVSLFLAMPGVTMQMLFLASLSNEEPQAASKIAELFPTTVPLCIVFVTGVFPHCHLRSVA